MDDSLKPVVIEFQLCLDDLLNEYNYKVFLHRDDEFVDFLILNRMNPKIKAHKYDFVIGVMSDSNPDDLIEKYRENQITTKELKEALKKWNSMEQLSLHNQNIGDY